MWRTIGATLALFAGLGLVYAAGPLHRSRPADAAPRATPETLPVPGPSSRGGMANGMPFAYSTAISRLSPEALVREFKAQGLESQSGDTDVGPLPPLQAIPASRDFVSAVRWSRDSPQDPPMPEVLLVFGRNPASTYRLRMTRPPADFNQYQPLQDLENRLGIFRSGLDISFGVLDKDGSFVFLGQDPNRRILSPGFTATMESAGWRPGLRNASHNEALACFSRWSKEVCFSRDQSGALLISVGSAGVILPGIGSNPPLP